VTGLIVVSPAFQRDHLEGREKVALTFVVEALAVVVDDYAIAMAPDHGVGLLSVHVNQLAVHPGHGACGRCAVEEISPCICG